MAKVVSIHVSKNFELINLAKSPTSQLMHQKFSPDFRTGTPAVI
jgi:hypothetical protein